MTAALDQEPTVVTPRVRLAGLDRLRGLAILLMVAQHAALLVWGWNAWEATAGRLVAPVFFLVGGSLVTRFTHRHWYVAALGVAVSMLIPWAGDPSSLLLYAAGAAVLVLVRRWDLGPWAVVALALTFYANDYFTMTGGYYTPAAVAGLMAVGSLIGRDRLAQLGRPLPGWLAPIGRAPLRWYVGHLAVLELARLVVTA